MKYGKKTLWQRFFGLGTALLLLLTLLAPGMTASAASTIDKGEKGSLTIYKYDLGRGDEAWGYGEYMTQEEMEQYLEETYPGYEDMAMPGIIFSYLKVGDVEQGVDSDENITIGYSIDDSNLLTLLGSSNLTVAFREGSTDYYTTSSLQTALSSLSQVKLEDFMSTTSGSVKTMKTDPDGMAQAEELDVGLYLVVETSYSSLTTATTRPFFVSIPMTDNKEEGGYTWEYDVVVYPKNNTDEIKIGKSVIGDTGETQYIDAEIGEKITFVVRADVPGSIGNIQKYTITDTMEDGLTYVADSVEVYGQNADGDWEALTVGTHYGTPDWDDGENKLTIDFIPRAMAESDDYTTPLYTIVEIRYNAYLNEDALLGFETGNSNSAELEFSTYTGTDRDDTTTLGPETTTVYTYGVALEKYFDGEANEELAKGVTFRLYEETNSEDGYQEGEDTLIDVSYDSTGGFYYLTGITEGTSETDGTMTVGSDGKLEICGLGGDTNYYLVEAGTADGYSMLEGAIVIHIDSNEGKFSEVEDGKFAVATTGTSYYDDEYDSGTNFAKLFKLKEYLNIDGSTLDTLDGEYHVNFRGPAWDDSKALTMLSADELEVTGVSTEYEDFTTNMNQDTGYISLIVNNSSQFSLPQTGGSGTMWFLIGGGIVVLAAVIVIVAVTRKKGSAQAE